MSVEMTGEVPHIRQMDVGNCGTIVPLLYHPPIRIHHHLLLCQSLMGGPLMGGKEFIHDVFDEPKGEGD